MTPPHELPLLTIQNLAVNIGKVSILQDINMQVCAGEIHLVLGANGAGKSTLGHVLVGKPGYSITAGTVEWQGEDLLALSPEERLHAGVFMAFQDPVAIPGVSTLHFLKTAVECTRKARGLPPWKAPTYLARIKEALESVSLPTSFLKRAVSDDFSGGEKKRHELAQMLLLEPKLIILDETDSGLDSTARQRLRDLLQTMKGKNAALLVITHYKELLQGISPDFVHVLNKGRLVSQKEYALPREGLAPNTEQS